MKFSINNRISLCIVLFAIFIASFGYFLFFEQSKCKVIDEVSQSEQLIQDLSKLWINRNNYYEKKITHEQYVKNEIDILCDLICYQNSVQRKAGIFPELKKYDTYLCRPRKIEKERDLELFDKYIDMYKKYGSPYEGVSASSIALCVNDLFCESSPPDGIYIKFYFFFTDPYQNFIYVPDSIEIQNFFKQHINSHL